MKIALYTNSEGRSSILYGIVAEHLDEFIQQAADSYERPLPQYVISELKSYLRCGQFEYGVLRCRCPGCGQCAFWEYLPQLRNAWWRLL